MQRLLRLVALASAACAASISTPSSSLDAPRRLTAAEQAAGYSYAFDASHVWRSAPAQRLSYAEGLGSMGRRDGWLDPRPGNGSLLDLVGNSKREPINAIISAKSDPAVLTDAGLRDYVRTIGFSFECLDLHMGGLQSANLGDGNGWVPELFEYRQEAFPGAPGRWVGACWESLYGGNHFRVWKQNGTLANTGAWFLAVSKEYNLRHHHMIVPDGYNLGRNLLVEAAEKGGKWKQWHWKARTEFVEGLLEPGKEPRINHNISQDGLVAVLTVERFLDVPGPTSVRYEPPSGPVAALKAALGDGAAYARSRAKQIRLGMW